MFPYILVGLATPVAAKIGSVKGLRLLWWVFPAAVLIIFAGLRGSNVGTDVPMYEAFFALTDPHSFTNTLAQIPEDPGFVALMFLTRQFTSDVTVFLTICAILTVYPVLIAARRVSDMPVFSLFLFVTLSYYPLSFNAVRQSIASSLVFLAETYRFEKRWLWLLLTMVAALIHISAFIASVVIFVLRLSRVLLLPLLISAAAVAVAGYPLAQIPVVIDLLNGLNDRYSQYLDKAVASGFGTVLSLGVHILIAVFCVVMVRRDGKLGIAQAPYVGIYTLTIPIMAAATSVVTIARLEPYFGMFAILALPQALATSKRRSTWMALIAIAAFAFYLVYISSYNDLVPYEFAGGR